MTHAFLFELGSVLYDRVTGYKGVAIARTTFLYQCDRYLLEPMTFDATGKVPDLLGFDAPALEFVEKSSMRIIDPVRPPDHDVVVCGDLVRHSLTGLTGTVTQVTTWRNGCIHVNVQPKGVGADGKPFPVAMFDEIDLEILEKASKVEQAKKETTRTTGGPRPIPTRR